MNSIYTNSKMNGRGQIKVVAQVEKGIEICISTSAGKGMQNVKFYLYATFSPKEAMKFSEHLAEVVRNKLVVIDFEATVIGLKSGGGSGDRNQSVHFDVELDDFKIVVASCALW